MKRFLKSVNWTGALFLLLTPPVGIILTIYYLATEGFQWKIWLLAAVFYTLTASSITAGYHRYFSHRTFEARSWVKWFWALFGAAAFQNSILVWSREHRVHHRFVDTDNDPYSINKGFWFAHIGWMLTSKHVPVKMEPYGRDLEKDPIVMFQHNYYVLVAIGMGFILPMVIGYFLGSALGGLAVAATLRIVAVHHFTFFINSWCHFFGRQRYTDTNTARDSVLMALATFGEGYHNFHHIFANDYRNGIRWYHWDPTKWIIKTLSWVGATYSLRKAPQSEIVRLQMEMDEKHLKSRLSNRWQEQFQIQLDNMKAQVHAAHERFEKLREEYRQSAKQYAQSKMERIEELKFQIRLAKIEFRAGLQQWRAYNSFLLAAVPA